ncbi:M1 family metallopeptidase [Lacinutrix jangbogonensis]|uniref:M1 family metallopeptidase n=1 Tax=Lacinutrix jangbogonensis TaxID=1469557 RepID=UPI001F156A7F|nr:M1 family metallopeptidase [Lacinutrix jangbogonensis]
MNARLVIVPDSTKVSGKVKYSFEILENIDSIYIDAINMKFKDVLLNDKKIEFINDLKKVWFKSKFRKNVTYSLTFNYVAYPKKAMYFVKRNEDWQIWTQGQGKFTSNWLPSIDDTNDKIEFDFSIVNYADYKVIANGKLIKREGAVNISQWHFNMQKPMSSYLVALAIGKYDKKEITSKSGIPLELYYYPEDSAKVEPTYRYTKQMFDFLEEEIGVPFPWQNYKQVPVKDFLYSGMENTSLTIFSDDFMIDKTSFVDKNYVNVNAHELAHQWFGDFVTATEGKHHWLQEGFATYYALLAERDIFGEDYYYNRLYEYAKQLIVQEQEDKATALLDPKASSITFYKKGAWALHVLKERVGEQVFKKAVINYLNKHAYKNVETNDFISEVEKISGQDLSDFEKDWLLSKELPISKMRATLKKNESIAFLETIEHTPYLSYRTDKNGFIPSSLVHELPKGFYIERLAVLSEALKKPDYPTYKDLIEEAFNSKEIKIRQLLAKHSPDGFKKESETLLLDASYTTIEIALSNLWSKFPKDRAKYLDATKDVVGFNDKNVRTLWLALALLTPEYNSGFNTVYIKELSDYTSSKYSFQTRQNAFSFINNLQIFNIETLINLIDATAHHNWRFKSFARDLLKSLSEEEKYKEIIANLQEQLKEQ